MKKFKKNIETISKSITIPDELIIPMLSGTKTTHRIPFLDNFYISNGLHCTRYEGGDVVHIDDEGSESSYAGPFYRIKDIRIERIHDINAKSHDEILKE